MNRYGAAAAARSLMLLVFCLAPPAAGAPAPKAPEGLWVGYIVGVPGEVEVDFSVTFSRDKDGALSGTMSVPSQNVESRPLEEVKFVAPTLSFVYRDGAGVSVLTGALSDDGQTVSGQHLEQDAKHPFELVRADGRAGGPAAELHDLTGADAFRKIFNGDADRIRLLLILSPSCGLCQENAQMVERRVLDKVKDAHLRVYVLWAPVSKHDDRKLAEKNTALVRDPRATHFWTGDLALPTSFAAPIGLKDSPAWDVFLVYGPGRQWQGEVPAPDFFMHRRGEILPQERRLNAIQLADVVAGLLSPRKQTP